MNNERIGFVGLGMMGLPMAKNLVEAGYTVTVFDLDAGAIEEAQEFGASPASTGAEVAAQSDIIITMVPDSPHVEAAIAGNGGIIEGIRAESVVIEMSTILPETGKRMAELLAEKGADFVDAPVTGGVAGAEAGSMSILVGGDAEAFERTLPVLSILGGDITHMGPVGTGHTTKIANQLILDMQTFYAAVKHGAGRSWALETLGPKILKGDFSPGFMVKHMQKDLRLAGQLADDTGTSIPTTSLIAQLYHAVQAESPEAINQGHQALIQAIEKLSNAEARS